MYVQSARWPSLVRAYLLNGVWRGFRAVERPSSRHLWLTLPEGTSASIETSYCTQKRPSLSLSIGEL